MRKTCAVRDNCFEEPADKRTDWSQARKKGGAMENATWRNIAKGLGFSVIYCLAYLAAWFNSLDQWFLPAGVRAAGMLLLPYRYWPYLFLGDAAALLMIRTPTAWQNSQLWAYLSPFILAPAISVVPIAFRKRLKVIHENIAWIPLIAISIAVWSSFCNLTLNFMLSGPVASDSAEMFLRYITGDCLGILMIVPPLLVWLRRKKDDFLPKKFAFDTCICISMIGIMFCATLPPEIEPALRQLLLAMMVLPAVGLTILHGWRGAAVGTTVANFAIAENLSNYNVIEAYDATSFIAQQILLITEIALLIVGAYISKLFDKARKLGVSEQHALNLAQSSFLSPEHTFRQKTLHMAQMQIALDEQWRSISSELKNLGHYQAAMDINAHGVEQKARFERDAMALYPAEIEKKGLFSALHSESFSRLWAGDAEVMLLTKGQPRNLSSGLQFAAYYCISNTFAFLSEFSPDYFEVKARVWKSRGRRGIVVIVTANPTTEAQSNDASILASLELEGRAKAYGGTVKRRHTHQISMLLSESIDPSTFNVRRFNPATPLAQ
jgi:hypothetical protein